MKRLIKLPLLLLAILLSGVLFSCSEEEEMSPEEKAISLPHLPDSIISWDTITIQKKSDGSYFSMKHSDHYDYYSNKYIYQQKQTQYGDIVEITDSTSHLERVIELDHKILMYLPDTLRYKIEGRKIRYLVEREYENYNNTDSTVYEYSGDYLVRTYHYSKDNLDKKYRELGYRDYIWKNGNFVEINYHDAIKKNPKNKDIIKIKYNDHLSNFIVPEATTNYYIEDLSNTHKTVNKSAWWLTKAMLINSGYFGKRPINDPIKINRFFVENFDEEMYRSGDQYENVNINFSYIYESNQITLYSIEMVSYNQNSYHSQKINKLLKW